MVDLGEGAGEPEVSSGIPADSEDRLGKVIRCYPGVLIYDSGRSSAGSEQARTQTE